MTYVSPDPLLTAKDAAQEAGLSLPGFWKAVDAARLPQPFYPASRAPRWRRSEIIAAVESTRARPRDQKMTRRAASAATGAELDPAA
jgi:predicted DNA-binding transcriptional regulator AlpA